MTIPFNTPDSLVRYWDTHQRALQEDTTAFDDTNDFLTQQMIDDCRLDDFDLDA